MWRRDERQSLLVAAAHPEASEDQHPICGTIRFHSVRGAWKLLSVQGAALELLRECLRRAFMQVRAPAEQQCLGEALVTPLLRNARLE